LWSKDRFNDFMAARKTALLEVISSAMGKAVLPVGGDVPAEDEEDEEDQQLMEGISLDSLCRTG
jgi:hypothetical protein